MSQEIAPQNPIVAKQTYASPMSYVGATRRLLAWADHDRATAAAIAVWATAVITMLLTWAFLVVWYAVVFGLFGVLAFPWRLHRRHQRKALHVQQVQLATMQTMMTGQQYQIAQEQARTEP